jgi:hypothetical protein
MSSENVELLREALLGRSGPDAFYELLDAAVEWDVSRAPGTATVIHGRGAVRAFLPSWRHGWEHWLFAEEDFVDADDRVVTITRDPAAPTGQAGEHPGRAAVWTFRHRKVVRFVWYERESEALADAGLGHRRR